MENIVVICNIEHDIEQGKCALCERDKARESLKLTNQEFMELIGELNNNKELIRIMAGYISGTVGWTDKYPEEVKEYFERVQINAKRVCEDGNKMNGVPVTTKNERLYRHRLMVDRKALELACTRLNRYEENTTPDDLRKEILNTANFGDTNK